MDHWGVLGRGSSTGRRKERNYGDGWRAKTGGSGWRGNRKRAPRADGWSLVGLRSETHNVLSHHVAAGCFKRWNKKLDCWYKLLVFEVPQRSSPLWGTRATFIGFITWKLFVFLSGYYRRLLKLIVNLITLCLQSGGGISVPGAMNGKQNAAWGILSCMCGI